MSNLTEADIEQLAIETLQTLGYSYKHGSILAPNGEQPERENYGDLILKNRLISAIDTLNPHLSPEDKEQAYSILTNISTPDLINNNETFHHFLVEGITIEYQKDGNTRGDAIKLIDFEHPENNDFLAVNQYTVIENNHEHRPDLILFINGLPLIVIELKNPTNEQTNLIKAFQQLDTYKQQIPSLFTYNAFLIISDGVDAKVGSLSANYSRFMQWKNPSNLHHLRQETPKIPQLETLTHELLNKTTLLDFIRHFIVFEKSKHKNPKTKVITITTVKKIAAYHQYYAVNKAIEQVILASGLTENQAKIGDKDNIGNQDKMKSQYTAGRKPKTPTEDVYYHYPKASEKSASYNIIPLQPPRNHQTQIGDKKGGVIWHTQGSGKSLSMVFLGGKLVLNPNLSNPTLIILTDRNDLDDQLFETFAASRQLLRQDPQQAENREQLQELLLRDSGGIIFTTVQKFAPKQGETLYPQLSPRSNIIILADEAHRSQYGFTAKEIDVKDEKGEIIGKKTAYGFAKYIRDAFPHATFVGFTGTPVENTDKNTPAIFGNYIDIYDIAQAVNDGATVPIYYESRLVKIELDVKGKRLLDELDEDLDGLDPDKTLQKAKSRRTRLEAVIGSSQRLETIAEDIITHFEARQAVFKGKGLIVTFSRSIAVKIYQKITHLRPNWHHDHLDQGQIKIVMTAAADEGKEIAKHRTTKRERAILADRLKNPEDPLNLVIVCDMWLTGFDAPCLHTLYIDKPMKGHNLMQAIARVNRVYLDKLGGLIVDYLGIANDLREAMAFYADNGGKGQPTLDLDQGINLMLTKLEIIEQLMRGFPYNDYFTANTAQKLRIILKAEDHILGLENGKDRFYKEVTALSRAFALVIPSSEAMAISEKVSFFQAVKVRLQKLETQSDQTSEADIDTAIKQVVDQALVSEGVIDIYDAAGIKKPNISIFSEEFLAEIRGIEQKNVAVELLKKLLNDEIKTRQRTNLVQSRKLTEMLENTILRYKNRVIDAIDVLEELIDMAKDMREADKRGENLGLEPYEVAFYDALAQNESATAIMGIDKLRELAVVLVKRIRENASIDWNLRDNVRARMRVMVKRLLRQYGYPPDMEALATELVLEQAKLFTEYTVNC